MWRSFEGGASAGRKGSEDGTIVRDEEHDGGARITLERDSRIAPFAITCGVYGLMVHTRFLGAKFVAEAEFERMKPALEELVGIEDWEAACAACAAFVQRFPT